MKMRDELLFDFSLHMPRVLVSGRTGVLDNVKRIVLASDTSIVVDCGKKFAGVAGSELSVDWMCDERMIISGQIDSIEFYGGSHED